MAAAAAAADAETALETISLLEARLLRIEHVLYGSSTRPAPPPPSTSAVDSLAALERRFSSLLSGFRVYAELLKIYKKHPSLFHAPAPSQPPTQLAPEAVRSVVLSFASAYPATASALTAATTDVPVPEPGLSAALIAETPRMRAVAATQRTHSAELAELRARSEMLLRGWYERAVLDYSQFVADVEGRVEDVEKGVRRAERAQTAEAGL